MNLKNTLKAKAPSVFFLVILVLIWDLVVRFSLVESYLLPNPLQVGQSLITDSMLFKDAFLSTLKNAFWGLSVAFGLGLGLAILFSLLPLLMRAIYPFTVFFQTLPVIAIAPLLVIWFGFGDPTVRASAALVAFFPILANSLTGLKNIPTEYRELFQTYKVPRLKALLYLELPAAFTFVLAGLKVSAGLVVVGAIVGEFIAGGGLGGLIDVARTQQRVDQIFAALFLSSLMGLLLMFFVRFIEDLILKVRPLISAERSF
jgi:NitT/TauT family transport system permease protein